MKMLAVLYGVVCYAIFFVTFLYAIAFVGNHAIAFIDNVGIPKGIDDGAPSALGGALIVNVLLLGVFAVQHSLMARAGFKAWWTKIVPAPVERSTYVLASSAALILLFWYWRPLPDNVWTVSAPAGVMALNVLFWLGWATVLLSTFLINHFDLFGLRQVWAYRRNHQIPPPEFHTPLFYKVVRHPLYLGFIVAFWATPVMSQGHLLFAFATTAYILIAIQLEERDLIAHFGDTYRAYKAKVSMILPLPRMKSGS